jgi:hypothetical protein
MKRIFTAAAVFALVAVTNPAHAGGDVSALTLRDWCVGVENARSMNDTQILLDKQKYPDVDKCYGAFLVIHLLLRIQDTETSRTGFFAASCPPDNLGFKQTVKVFDHYVDQHPETANQLFIGPATVAFNTAWPCSLENRRTP